MAYFDKHFFNYRQLANNLLIFFLFTGVLCTSKSFAQDSADSLQVELDPIKITAIHSTVSAANAPLALTNYSRNIAKLNSQASLSLQSISKEIPGLWVNNRQNYALGERLTIRGIGWRAAFGVRGIQVVYNDIPITVADGQTMINIIDPAFIRRAELVRGPAATYWGNSSGGVLYLSTRPSYDEENSFRLRTMTGSYGMRKVEGAFSLANSSHKMSGYTSYITTDGFRDYSKAQVLRSGVTGSINISPKEQLKYQAAAIYMPTAQHPSALNASQAQNSPTMAVASFANSNSGKEITQTQGGLTYIRQTNAGILNITGYGIYRDLNNPLPFGIITVNRWAGGLRATFDKSWNKLSVQMGLESKFQNDDRAEFENIGNAERGDITVDQIERIWNQAAFATATYSFNSFNIMGGIRYDRLRFEADAASTGQLGERTFDSISPTIGATYHFGSTTAYTNLSTSFEAPTTTELVNRPGGGNGFNPELLPERTLGIEAGIRSKTQANDFTYDLSFYNLWIKDLLFPYQLETNGPIYYRNQGETRHRGIEGKLSWQINRFWDITGIANITHAEFKKAETLDNQPLGGKKVPGIPLYRFNAVSSWTPGNFRGSITYKYVSDYDVNNLNTAYNEAYGIVNMEFSYRYSIQKTGVVLQPYMNVNNIMDVRYNGSVTVNAFGNRYFEPAPGRNWQLGISVNF